MSIDTYFCFCCLSTDDLSPIYNDTDADHGSLLLQLFNLIISYEDYEFDGYICKACAQSLKDAAKFKAQVFDVLNVLRSNGLIELSSDDYQTTVKKVTTGNIEAEEKYDKIIVEDMVTNKVTPEDISKTSPIKKETSDIPKPKLERDKQTDAGNIQKITQYEVTDDLKCEICEKEMPNAYVYHAHMNEHFPNHICDTCGKGFLTERRLKRHMPSHKTGPFKCQTCEAEFTNYNTLNSHRQRKHSSTPLYRCPVGSCGARFGSLQRRAVHLATAHARIPRGYTCRLCDKTFLVAGNLSSHMRNKHQKVQRHFCGQCRAGFAQRQELAAHVAAHTGLRDFHCAHCTKRYPRKKALVVHMRTHNDDRRFSCEYCGKRFIQKCTLLVHVKTHNKTAKATVPLS